MTEDRVNNQKSNIPIWHFKSWYKHQGELNPLRRLTYTVVGVCIAIPMLALLFIIANASVQGASPNEVYFFGVRPTLVVTNSMEPAIMTNSLVIVEDVPFEEIEVGDIIRYDSHQMGYSVIHRVMTVGDGWVCTKGDNNPTMDRWIVTSDMYNGKVSSIHNGAAPFVSLIFGRFDMERVAFSFGRILVGFAGLAIVVTAILLSAYYIFEYVTIHIYWTRHRDKMQNSLNWMDSNIDRGKFNSLISQYNEAIRATKNPLSRAILRNRLRSYYDILCSQESKAIKAERRLKKLNNSIDKALGNTSTEQTDTM